MFGDAAVEDFGDVRMIHHRESLSFGLKAGEYLFRIHAGFDQFDGNLTFDRLLLLSDPDRSHPAFADILQQFVAASEDRSRLGFVLRNERGFRILLMSRGLKIGVLQSIVVGKKASQTIRQRRIFGDQFFTIRSFTTFDGLNVVSDQRIKLGVMRMRIRCGHGLFPCLSLMLVGYVIHDVSKSGESTTKQPGDCRNCSVCLVGNFLQRTIPQVFLNHDVSLINRQLEQGAGQLQHLLVSFRRHAGGSLIRRQPLFHARRGLVEIAGQRSLTINVSLVAMATSQFVDQDSGENLSEPRGKDRRALIPEFRKSRMGFQERQLNDIRGIQLPSQLYSQLRVGERPQIAAVRFQKVVLDRF